MNNKSLNKIQRLAGMINNTANKPINRFEYIFENISFLNEISVEDAYNKYYKDIEKDIFDKIVSSDPFSKPPKFLSEYAKWLLKLYKNEELNLEDLEAANEYIAVFDKYKHSLYKGIDITKKNLADLFNIVKDKLEYEKTNVDLCEVIDGAEKVYNSSEWCIIIPKTEYASCYYGRHTEWCTTWGPLSFDDRHKSKTNRFAHHNSEDPLFILINKQDNSKKYQFHFAKFNQFKDTADKEIDIISFLRNNKEILDFFLKVKKEKIKELFVKKIINKIDEENIEKAIEENLVLASKFDVKITKEDFLTSYIKKYTLTYEQFLSLSENMVNVLIKNDYPFTPEQFDKLPEYFKNEKIFKLLIDGKSIIYLHKLPKKDIINLLNSIDIENLNIFNIIKFTKKEDSDEIIKLLIEKYGTFISSSDIRSFLKNSENPNSLIKYMSEKNIDKLLINKAITVFNTNYEQNIPLLK